jgi:hypothetical protein
MRCSRLAWGQLHRLPLVGGAALAYAWHAFLQVPVIPVSQVADLVGNAAFAVGLVERLAVAARPPAA